MASLLAAVLSGAALAVALTRTPPPSRFPLICGEQFRDAQTQATVSMYVPCSEVRP
jgi:hypothetical protein